MDCLHFNSFYRPYVKALKIKNIYKNKFKLNNIYTNILYLFSYIAVISLIVLDGFYSRNDMLFSILLAFSVCFLISIDIVSLKNSIRMFRKKYKVKLMFPDLFDQLKYYLWKDKLGNLYLSYSIDKALSYLEIELSQFDINKNEYSQLSMAVLTGVTICAFWALFDIANFDKLTKKNIYTFILIFSYMFIKYKFIIFGGKKKRLLLFRQYLLRLKSERIDENEKNISALTAPTQGKKK